MPEIKRIKDYEVTGEIGRGGMGVVYKARHLHLDRPVALKTLPSIAASSEKVVQRFHVEAAAAAQLSHPGIVQIFEAGESEGVHYIAMEYVSGRGFDDESRDVWRAVESKGTGDVETLRIDLDSQGSFASHLAEADEREEEPDNDVGHAARYWNAGLKYLVSLIMESARALEAAHLAGVLHRDVKPGNVLVTDSGTVKIVDFGLARIGEGRSLTLTGEIIGTPAYMSPEQLSTKDVPIDERTDVYSLGVTLYEAISHRLPFEAPSVQSLIQRILTLEPSRPRRWNRKIPRDLETVCLKAMEKDQSQRYQTMKEFADDLERFLKDIPVLARPAGPITRVVKLVRRRRVAAIASAVALVAVVVTLILYLQIMGMTREERIAEARDLVYEGHKATVLGRNRDAKDFYTRALVVNPKSVEALVSRGIEYFVEGNYEEARKDFEQGRDIQKDYPPLREAYACYLQEKGETGKAAELRKGLDDSGITDPLHLDCMGLVYSVSGDHISAIKMFRDASDKKPLRLPSIMGEGWAAFYLGRYGEADRLLGGVHKMVSKSKLPTLLLVYIRWYMATYTAGQYRSRLLTQARGYVNELEDLVGKDAMATLACAAVDCLQEPEGKNVHEPVECAQKAVDLYEDEEFTISDVPGSLFYEIMSVLQRELDQDLAAKYAKEARERSARGLADLVLGLLAAGRGETDQALNCFQTVLEKAPQNPYALVQLLQLGSAGNDARLVVPLETRAEYAQQIVKVKPDDPRMSLVAGHALREAGKYESALTAYRHASSRWTKLEDSEKVSEVEAIIQQVKEEAARERRPSGRLP